MKTLDLVVKIGSMALIQKEDNSIDYNIFQRLGEDLRPGMILVTSGATEIGRLDYMKRMGYELAGVSEDDKVDYASQGQTILMNTYRQFIKPEYGIRQVLVEHTHFNDPQRREHIKRLLQRAAEQNVIPIINYNDTVSDEELRKMELASRKAEGVELVVECVDNDETAEVVADLVDAKTLILLTSTKGIYLDLNDPSTLVELVTGDTIEEVREQVTKLMKCCVGASRSGANGAGAKLSYALRAVESGSNVIIGHAKYHIHELLEGKVPCTRLGVGIGRKER
ncbi:MAG: uridylate kinase [Clostridiales bacterium]|nr:uridylate kinase [Clostridiales bacterium]